MIESFAPRRRSGENALASLLKSAAILRIGAGVVLMTRHAWDALIAAYQFLWKEIPWSWVGVFEKQGVPFPLLTTPVAALLLFMIAVAWIVGFLTRLFSILLCMLCALALVFASTDYTAFSELCWLYLLIAFTLTLFGSGVVSLDHLFRLGANRGKPQLNRY